jgi:hypothetical protein
MRRKQWLAAALLGLTALAARAESVVWYNVVAQQGSDGPAQSIESDNVLQGAFSTDGPVTASSGVASASFSAVADPVMGVFKSLAHASITDGTAASTALAQGYLALSDHLQFTAAADVVRVTFTLSWDTHVSGWGNAIAPTVESLYSGTQSFNSTQFLTLGSAAPAAPDNGGCELSEHAVCADTFAAPPRPVHEETGTSFMDPDGTVWTYGQGDGHWTGQKLVTFDVPTGQDLLLNYTASTSAVCFYLSGCDLGVDASHSDYIGISVEPGVTFTSSSGYRYAGLAGAVPAVPEPAAWMLALFGLVPIVARSRRRAS